MPRQNAKLLWGGWLLMSILVSSVVHGQEEWEDRRWSIQGEGGWSITQTDLIYHQHEQTVGWGAVTYRTHRFISLGWEFGYLSVSHQNYSSSNPTFLLVNNTSVSASTFYTGPCADGIWEHGPISLSARVGAGMVNTNYTLHNSLIDEGVSPALTSDLYEKGYLTEPGFTFALAADWRLREWMAFGIGFRDLLILEQGGVFTSSQNGNNFTEQTSIQTLGHHFFMPFARVTFYFPASFHWQDHENQE